jgi:hypothetical protein
MFGVTSMRAIHTKRGCNAATLLRLLITLLVMLTAPVSAAQSPRPAADEIERSLTGDWVGALEYRDYQSGRTFELPVTTRIAVAPDNATITRLSAFDDGPKTGMVYITTVSLFDATGTRSTQSTFRKGRTVDTWTETAAVKSFTDLQNWAMTYSRTGTDGDKLADIRMTVTRKGDELLTVKEVKEPNAPDSSFANRNQTRLKKKPG